MNGARRLFPVLGEWVKDSFAYWIRGSLGRAGISDTRVGRRVEGKVTMQLLLHLPVPNGDNGESEG